MRPATVVGCAMIVASMFMPLSNSVAQTVQTNMPAEISLTSSRSYPSPQRDLVIICTWTSPRGTVDQVHGFWDGGRTYRVRYSPDIPGVWTWRITCNDSTNISIHGRSGSITVVPYEGNDEFRRLGWLKVSDNKRHLTYANGDPFFYLGDTAWEMTHNAEWWQVRGYASQLRRKGYNVVQMCTMSHLQVGGHGVDSWHSGDSFKDRDAFIPNPGYYAWMDSIITLMNDSGIAVALVPNWNFFTTANGDSTLGRLLTYEEGVELARYVGARYAGHNVIWITTADGQYPYPRHQTYWTGVGRMLHTATGARHLVTIHPIGGEASFHFFDSTATWLDFHMYQSSHDALTPNHWRLGLEGYRLNPPKPVLNAECNYEDLFTTFSARDTTKPNSFRLRPEHVRDASWKSVLSGAIVGITHGANGVWQWYVTGHEPFLWPRFPVEQAWTMDSYDHIALLKSICQQYHWYRFVPRPELVSCQSDSDHIAISEADSVLLAWFPVKAKPVAIDVSRFNNAVSHRWLNPVTGSYTDPVDTISRRAIDSLIFTPPTKDDWLLVISRSWKDVQVPTAAQTVLRFSFITRSSSGRPGVEIRSNVDGFVRLAVFDVTGRRLKNDAFDIHDGVTWIPVDGLPPGPMFYTADCTALNGVTLHHEGRFVSPGR